MRKGCGPGLILLLALLLLPGIGGATEPSGLPTVPAQRVVSLLPSLTEAVCVLGEIGRAHV